MIDLTAHDLDPVRGFLPAEDPLRRMPAGFEAWDEASAGLPGLLIAGQVRRPLEELPELDPRPLPGRPELRRAFLLLSVLANAYIMGEGHQAAVLPRNLAVPLAGVARRLGMPPVFTYASMILYNWARIDPRGPVDLGNLATLRGYYRGMDESWFFLSMAAIEARGAPAVAALPPALRAVTEGDDGELETRLAIVAASIERMIETLERVPERCDPYVFYRRVRPILDAWQPPGVIYEGVAEAPQMWTAASAAQCALIQALDAALGIAHGGGGGEFLRGMRGYMPPGHRRFLAALDAGPSVRDFLLGHPRAAAAEVYNACVQRLGAFRKKHLELTVRYVVRQAEQAGDEVSYGTSGTDLAHFLGQVRKDTGNGLIQPAGA